MKIKKKEIARDLRGLGSVPFLVLVVVRVAMAGNFEELFQIAAAVVLLGLVSLRVPGIHFHTARIVILVIFTSVFYDDPYFTGFAVLTGLISVYSFVRYLEQPRVILSLNLGLLCSALSYLISIPLGIPNI